MARRTQQCTPAIRRGRLQKADKNLAKDLSVLLEMKTLAAYSDRAVSPTKRKQAARAMRRLVDAANAEQ